MIIIQSITATVENCFLLKNRNPFLLWNIEKTFCIIRYCKVKYPTFFQCILLVKYVKFLMLVFYKELWFKLLVMRLFLISLIVFQDGSINGG